jgi:acyl carrier protein
MTKQELEAKIRKILVEDFRVPAASVEDGATFRGTFRLDSLDIVDFILLLQKDFGFKAPTESYRELDSFAKLVAFVERTLRDRERAAGA